MSIPTSDITGLVLCGGRGSRMGGVDKGLQLHLGQTLVQHTLQRLLPQVGGVIINANRNLDRYRALGHPVCSDAADDFAGPLAGWLAGLLLCRTPYLLTVPCDTPGFPQDLAARLAQALMAEEADITMAATQEEGGVQRQPVFCLLKTALLPSLADELARGQRKIDRWTSRHRLATVVFEDPQAFVNANTLDDLQRLG